jgi:hypothetical protein
MRIVHGQSGLRLRLKSRQPSSDTHQTALDRPLEGSSVCPWRAPSALTGRPAPHRRPPRPRDGAPRRAGRIGSECPRQEACDAGRCLWWSWTVASREGERRPQAKTTPRRSRITPTPSRQGEAPTAEPRMSSTPTPTKREAPAGKRETSRVAPRARSDRTGHLGIARRTAAGRI